MHFWLFKFSLVTENTSCPSICYGLEYLEMEDINKNKYKY